MTSLCQSFCISRDFFSCQFYTPPSSSSLERARENPAIINVRMRSINNWRVNFRSTLLSLGCGRLKETGQREMSAILQAERQTALGETSSSECQEQRRWKKPNEVVRIRRKVRTLTRSPVAKCFRYSSRLLLSSIQLSRKPSLKSIPGQRSESLREVTKRTTPVLKRTSENLAASTPPKVR